MTNDTPKTESPCFYPGDRIVIVNEGAESVPVFSNQPYYVLGDTGTVESCDGDLIVVFDTERNGGHEWYVSLGDAALLLEE